MAHTNSSAELSRQALAFGSEGSWDNKNVENNSGKNPLPFPVHDKHDDGHELSQDVKDPQASSPDSRGTASTPSDKLSALPTSTSIPNTNRILRSPVALSPSTYSNILPNRGYRRSLDASASLPSFSTPGLDSPPQHVGSVWGTPQRTVNNVHLSPRGTSPDGSLEKGTPRQRVSFDSDRASIPTMHRQAFTRLNKGSDPPVTSPAQRSLAYRDSQNAKDPDSMPGSRSPSHSRSRAASPLRLFQHWSSGRHHRHRSLAEEPFVPVDPFKFKAQLRLPCFPKPDSSVAPKVHTHDYAPESPESAVAGCEACVPPPETIRDSWASARISLGDTLPRQMYLNVLLRIPAMYFSRVARIFEDAEVSRPDIQRMIESGGGGSGSAFLALAASASEQVTVGTVDSTHNHVYPPGTLSPTMATAGTPQVSGAGVPHQLPLPFPDEWTPPLVSPALIRFKHSWEAFIDSLLREWKTLNVVSALLASAIFTIFQIPSAEEDPVTRTAALLSLVCALMSLSYGCMYIVKFGTMRSMFRASRWAEEARKTDTLIWWNVWVLLAMPAVWMSWSMLLFFASILSFVWRTGSVADPEVHAPLSVRASFGPRIAVTGMFAVGLVYFALIVKTLQSYGTADEGPGTAAWRRKAAQAPAGRMGLRARDIDAAMERRGRERQRSASGSRRKEEAPEEGKGASVEAYREERRGLRSLLGLGIMGLGAREQDPSGQLDVEKGEGR